MASKKSWQEIAADAQAHRDATIAHPAIQPPVPDIPDDLPDDVTGIPRDLLSSREITLTESKPEVLVMALRVGWFSAVEVTQAFLRRAGLAQRLVNCLTELLPEQALKRAEELDEYLRKRRRPVGPLHGLPVSVKEHVSMKDLSLSLGYVARYGNGIKGDEDALALKLLWDAGAVFYCRTTEPQTIMHLECSSNLYGVTVNPFNRHLSSGGSSGGEGALMAMGGSCLGIGTDIGGSIRSPAGNCGNIGLRPSAYRFPYRGVEATAIGPGGIMPVQGPLATSFEGIKMYAKAMLAPRAFVEEEALAPIPWKDLPPHERGRRLKIGVMWHDGVVKPHPPIARALKEVVHKLREIEGVEVVDFKGVDHNRGWEIISSLYFPDGGDGEHAEIDPSGEPLRPLTKWLLEEDGHVKRLSMEDLWYWQQARADYKQSYHEAWIATGNGSMDDEMDVLLCPYSPSASSILDNAKYWSYTSTFNLLDYPALVFPVDEVDPTTDKVEENFSPLSEKDKWNHAQYDPEKFRGAPVSLQLVCRRFQEEKLISIAQFFFRELELPFN